MTVDPRATMRAYSGSAARNSAPTGRSAHPSAIPTLALRRRDRGTIEVSGSIAAEFAVATPLDHLVRLSDDTALLEHAEGAVGRREHGYCTDDVARLLLVACLRNDDTGAAQLADRSLAFVRHAAHENNRFRSRMNYQREWIDAGASDDASGRALWALGVAVRDAPWQHVRAGAQTVFDRMAGFRSEHWHATAFAALGAAAVLDVDPGHAGAAALGAAAVQSLPRRRRNSTWLWPQDRVTYTPALLADALMALSVVDAALLEEGLVLLRWVANITAGEFGFSPTPAGGMAAGDARPGFDQQPIEAQAFASAAHRAFTITHDPEWLELLLGAAAWFLGRNDSQVPLIDRATGGCCDGLQKNGRNPNQGAESTLAYLHTMAILQQCVRASTIVLNTRAVATESGYSSR